MPCWLHHGDAHSVREILLAPDSVLRQIHQKNPDIRLHLIGHSFGGRVVTAAADALDTNTPQVTITLLQAAYSHNSLSKNSIRRTTASSASCCPRSARPGRS